MTLSNSILSARIVAFVGPASMCVWLAATSVSAQVNSVDGAAPAVGTPVATPPESQRDAEYASLARDVQAMDREFAIVKRVVKLVTPAVVHIESKPLAPQ